ncbi:MAG: CotH kinase family protein, partial [Chloroflexota bacterium]
MTILEATAKTTESVRSTLKRASRPLSGIWSHSAEAVLGLFALLIVGFALLTYYPPAARIASSFSTGNRYLAIAEGLINPFRSPRVLMNSGLPVYDLEVNHTEMARIDEAIEEALQQGYMDEEQQVWARGRFHYDGQDYNVRIRTRGDLPPHWEDAKKSWRIRFGESNVTYNGETSDQDIYFQGKEQINLIIPWDRDYIVAPFVNALMREAGLVAPQDSYAILRLNGVVQGLYYQVEHFDNALLAAYQRPETTVTGQNDRAMHFEQYTKYGTAVVSDSWYDMGVVNLQVEEEGPTVNQALQALQVLYEHSINPTPANFERVRAVLDWEKYLSFRNVTTLLNTNHVRFGSDNFKLYFDPSRGLLEPIPWDVHLVRMPDEPGTIDFWNEKGPDEIQRATLLDPHLRLQRNKMLWEWVDDGGDRLLDQYNALHEEIRPLAWADVLSTPVHGYRMDVLKKDLTFNVKRMHKVLGLSTANVTYRLEAADRASLEVVALNFSGIQMQEIRVTDPDLFEGDYQLYQDVNGNGEFDPQDALVAETTATNGSVRFLLDHYVFPELNYSSEIIDGGVWTYMEPLAGRQRYFLIGKVDRLGRDPLLWTRPDIQVFAENAVTGQDMPSDYIVSGDQLPENYIGVLAYDASNVLDLQAPELTLTEFLERNPQFSASDSRPGAAELRGSVVISGTVIVPRRVPLILQPGVDITMTPNATLLAYGGLTGQGTADQRIRIHGDNSGRPWGSFAAIRPPDEVVLQYIDVSGGGQAQANGLLLTGGLAVHEGDLRLENCQVGDMFSEDGLNLKSGQVH